MDTTTQTPVPYITILAEEIITFGSCTSEWVVLDHPSTGNGTLMVKCMKGAHGKPAQHNDIRLLVEGETKVYLVEPRQQ